VDVDKFVSEFLICGLLWKGDYAPGCGFLLHGFALLILQFSLVEAHARIVIE